MSERTPRWFHIVAAICLYPLLHLVFRHVSNPMIPDAVLALHMTIPVLAGFMFGPVSGTLSGGIGTALAALLYGSLYDALAILPHAVMGCCAGLSGRNGSEFKAAPCILVGHVLNLLFFARFGMLDIFDETIDTTLLGLLSEFTVDIVVIIFLAALFKPVLYCRQRF